MLFPTVSELIRALRPVKMDAKQLEAEATSDTKPENLYIEVRLQVHDEGGWALHTGSAQYDDDHTGFWGEDYIGPESDLREVAKGLIQEVKDHAYIYGDSK